MNRIKELRQKKKLTQKELAKELGLTQTVIGKYEHGDISPRPDKWQKMADFFGVSVDYLKGAWSKDQILKLVQDCYIENLDYIDELEKARKDIIKQKAVYRKEIYPDILNGVKEQAIEKPQTIFKNVGKDFDAKTAVNSNEFKNDFSELFDKLINIEFEQKRKNIKLASLTESESDNKEKLLAASIQDYFESIKDYLAKDATFQNFNRLYPLTFLNWPNNKNELKKYLKEYASGLNANLQIALNGPNKMLVLGDSYIWQVCFSNLFNDELVQNLMQTKAPKSTLLIAIRLTVNSYTDYLDNLVKEI